jgi:hypothetical protein
MAAGAVRRLQIIGVFAPHLRRWMKSALAAAESATRIELGSTQCCG